MFFETEESFIGKTAVKMIAETDEKSLIVTVYLRIFTKYHWLVQEKRMLDLNYPAENVFSMGNYIYEAAGDVFISVLTHFFLPDSSSFLK